MSELSLMAAIPALGQVLDVLRHAAGDLVIDHDIAEDLFRAEGDHRATLGLQKEHLVSRPGQNATQAEGGGMVGFRVADGGRFGYCCHGLILLPSGLS